MADSKPCGQTDEAKGASPRGMKRAGRGRGRGRGIMLHGSCGATASRARDRLDLVRQRHRVEDDPRARPGATSFLVVSYDMSEGAARRRAPCVGGSSAAAKRGSSYVGNTDFEGTDSPSDSRGCWGGEVRTAPVRTVRGSRAQRIDGHAHSSESQTEHVGEPNGTRTSCRGSTHSLLPQ